MFYVYILQSLKCGRYYIGYSAHPEIRLKQHNSGEVKSTKAYVPYKQILIEKYNTRSEAMCREKELKKMKTGVKFQKLVGSSQWQSSAEREQLARPITWRPWAVLTMFRKKQSGVEQSGSSPGP